MATTACSTYATGYNSPLRPVTLTTTGAVGDTDLTLGWETAFVWDSFSVQTEGANIHVNRFSPGRRDLDINTGFVFGSWFVTGERRQYGTKGEFSRPRRSSTWWTRTAGAALEVLARFDWADLTDAKATNGIGLPNAGTYKRPYAFGRHPGARSTTCTSWPTLTHGNINNPGALNDRQDQHLPGCGLS